LAFIFFGFITTLGRLARSSIRPLFVPVPGDVTSTSPTFAKRVYDVAGIVATIMMINYGAGAFMLGTVESSSEFYRRVAWHGHILLVAGLLFFYGGGSRVLKKMQARRIKNFEGKRQTNGLEVK
jgi:lysophospholipid acyltransferase